MLVILVLVKVNVREREREISLLYHPVTMIRRAMSATSFILSCLDRAGSFVPFIPNPMLAALASMTQRRLV